MAPNCSCFISYILFATLLIFSIVRWNTNRLKLENQRLEKVIEERTFEIRQQKEEIEKSHHHVSESLNAAKPIQEAIVTSYEYITSIFPENFVLYLPKDVVSGDFYWMYKNTAANKVFWTVSDCTGHGVPGAFMSMIGVSLLNEVVIENKYEKPDEILWQLRARLNKALNNEKVTKLREGMDMTFCSVDYDSRILEISGARNAVWILRKTTQANKSLTLSAKGNKQINLFYHENGYSIIEYKGDRQPIGYHKTKNENPFQRFSCQLEKGDIVYQFSDGYADQKGGVNGKKYYPVRLKELLFSMAEKNLNDQLPLLNKEFDSWKGDTVQIDDVCILGVRIQ
jgi:serine phosphatase RsbU (regulator of sigma subunit)